MPPARSGQGALETVYRLIGGYLETSAPKYFCEIVP